MSDGLTDQDRAKIEPRSRLLADASAPPGALHSALPV
jgi:hypothetical protein